jgi:hypothetical protein
VLARHAQDGRAVHAESGDVVDESVTQFVVRNPGHEQGPGTGGGGCGSAVERVTGEPQPHRLSVRQLSRRGQLDEHLTEHDHSTGRGETGHHE